MINKLKQPQMIVGLAIIFIVIVIMFFVRNTSSQDVVRKGEAAVDSSAVIPSDMALEIKPDIHNGHLHEIVTEAEEGNTTSRHQDMLTDEMKQAIRDKLLSHGKMEVIQHPDGRFELPSNGRFTQVPVAVKMPDGTIQIKEYSSLPE